MSSFYSSTTSGQWIRNTAGTITSIAAAGAIIWGVGSWIVAPRVDVWAKEIVSEATAELAAQSQTNKRQLSDLGDTVGKLADTIVSLADRISVNNSASWRFSLPDTSISDGQIGGQVMINAAGYKLRECGIPRVDIYFKDSSGSYHRFSAPTFLTQNQRGVALLPDPKAIQRVSYRASIPDSESISSGRAQGFLSVSYPDGCPSVEEAIAGPLHFNIQRAKAKSP